MKFRPLLAFLLSLSSLSLSQGAEAKVSGQSKVYSGVQFVLSSEGSTGTTKWITDPAIEELNSEFKPVPFICGTQYGLSLFDPGTYYFHLIAADENGIDVVLHKVEVLSRPGQTSPDIPDEPENPSFSKVIEASNSSLPSDLPTASALKQALSAVKVGPSLDATKFAVTSLVESTLLQRKGSSRDADWQTWRTTVGSVLSTFSSTESYIDAIHALATSLPSSPQGEPETKSVVPAKVKLTVYSAPWCVPCQTLKRLELPQLTDWDVTVYDSVKMRAYPTLVLEVPGKSPQKFVGYQTASKLREHASY